MFGKLMKYELRYLIRIFAPMWAAVMLLCATFRLTVNPEDNGMMYMSGLEAFLPALLVMLVVFAIITMMIVSTVVLLQRFYKGMYGDEGYLMFTLPVTSGALIHSKALSAVLMQSVTILVTVVGLFVMVSYEGMWSELVWSFPEYMEVMDLTNVKLGLIVFWAVILVIVGEGASMYGIYLAISLGQIWKKHPVAGAIIAYYGMSMVLAGISNAFVATFGGTFDMVIVEKFLEANVSETGVLVAAMLFNTLGSLLLGAVSFIGTKLLLDKKLNIS